MVVVPVCTHPALAARPSFPFDLTGGGKGVELDYPVLAIMSVKESIHSRCGCMVAAVTRHAVVLSVLKLTQDNTDILQIQLPCMLLEEPETR